MDVKEVKNDLEAWFDRQSDVVYENLRGYLLNKYNGYDVNIILDVIREKNQLIVSLEDMTTFRYELRDKLKEEENK